MLLADDINERQEESGDTKAEIERLRTINKKLRRKYQEATQEIKDLGKEHERGKTELLDIIRMQEKDLKFSDQICKIMLRENDQYKLRERSSWDEETRDWTIPLFILQKIQDEVAFPTIGAKARVEQARVDREVYFTDELHPNGSGTRSREKYSQENYSEQDGDSDIHNPDMQWNKFGKRNEARHLSKNQANSQMSGDNGTSALRKTSRNDAIDGIHDRRKKYLGPQITDVENIDDIGDQQELLK